MTTWILAVVLMALSAGLGFKRGAVRVFFSMAGIVVAALLATPMAKLLTPALKPVLKNAVYEEVTGLVVGFLIVLIIFHVVGQLVHQWAENQQRQTGEVRRKLWVRLNTRLGLWLGLVNGLLYFVLVSAAIYMGSYWTVQMTTPDTEPQMGAKVLNRMGKDLQESGMTKVAEAVNTVPDSYYQAADVVGLVYNNPVLASRLSRYPSFLSLGMRPELRELANDPSFMQLLTQHAPLGDVLKHKRTQELFQNQSLLNDIRFAIEPNLPDIKMFLETGKSERFGNEPIVGRWLFDSKATLATMRREKPNMPSAEFAKIRLWVTTRFAKAALVAAPDQQLFFESFPKPNMTEMETITGHWRNTGGRYLAQVDNTGGDVEISVASPKLALTWENLTLLFTLEQ